MKDDDDFYQGSSSGSHTMTKKTTTTTTVRRKRPPSASEVQQGGTNNNTNGSRTRSYNDGNNCHWHIDDTDDDIDDDVEAGIRTTPHEDHNHNATTSFLKDHPVEASHPLAFLFRRRYHRRNHHHSRHHHHNGSGSSSMLPSFFFSPNGVGGGFGDNGISSRSIGSKSNYNQNGDDDEDDDDDDDDVPKDDQNHQQGNDLEEQEENPQQLLPKIHFRTVLPRDRIQIQRLHEEWFPVEYDPEFYDELCTHQQMVGSGHPLITLLATVPSSSSSSKSKSTAMSKTSRRKRGFEGSLERRLDPHSSCQVMDDTTTTDTDTGDDNETLQDEEVADEEEVVEEDPMDETIIGCLIGCFVSADKLNRTSRRLLVPEYERYQSYENDDGEHNHHHHHHHHRKHRRRPPPPLPPRHGTLFYIMTLGVVQKYRHLGLATTLVQRVFHNTIVPRGDECGCMYLHVITFNDAAMQFYERKLGFWNVQEIPNYYTIDGQQHNCYLYAKYFHGNRGHLDLYKIVSRWVSTVWTTVTSHLWVVKLKKQVLQQHRLPASKRNAKCLTPSAG